MRTLPGLLPLLLLLATPWAARAAQDYQSCTGFIDTLPASIATQGTWCLRGHKYTSQTSGAAITVLTDNVTIDCNHFRLSGLGAGAATDAMGITAGASRLNATVRHCRIQGFKYGVALFGAHHLVERNRFDYNTYTGIHVIGDHHVIQANEVLTTGGRPGAVFAQAIYARGPSLRITGNTVHGVRPVGSGSANRFVGGILGSGLIEDNHVSGLDVGADGLGSARGITGTQASIIRRNNLVQGQPTAGVGILGSGTALCVCRDNNIVRYQYGIQVSSCELAGFNIFLAGGPAG
jgi:hypothetical protein